MKTTSLILSIHLSCILCVGVLAELPQAAVTIKIVDEDEQSVPGAMTGAAYNDSSSKSMVNLVKGLTDSSGLFLATAKTEGFVSYGATKEGYYKSVGEQGFSDVRGNRWQPWNPVIELVLKRIINPVPMYARRAIIELPRLDTEAGFDLEAADWVKPWGNGIQRDFVFRLTKRFASRNDYEAKLQLSFSHEGDGVQNVYVANNCGSELRLPRNAPPDGYEAVWDRTDACPNTVRVRPDQNYFFRVRTEMTDGKVHKALYGKIHGEIRFDVINSKTAIIIFTYYLNPDGTRNLEFDQKRNLFQNLKSRETPH
ncbi:MAG: hypothetical protein WC740_00465 [Verrucomicrobiia bacterium]